MTTSITCQDENRRKDVRADADLNGIDYIDIGGDDHPQDQSVLVIHFLDKAPEDITIANLRIDGGRRIRDVRVETILEHKQPPSRRLADRLTLRVNHPGDFSPYTLSIVEADEQGLPGDQPLSGFDPRYFQAEFSFKVNCPSDLDCAQNKSCAPVSPPEPEIDYLSKDYASFRQLILDRLSLIVPGWQERHVPDLGLTLVEVLAYVGDDLSYYQDAVATEAYLGTARQRISIRRHGRLVDYAMHEGCNARAWVRLEVNADITDFDLGTVTFIAGGDASAPASSRVVYEAVVKTIVSFYKSHNSISFYTWDNERCHLPKGATSATLFAPQDKPKKQHQQQAHHKHHHGPHDGGPPHHPVPMAASSLQLKVGDVLVFEEVIGVRTGFAADADPSRRHVVRLTKVTYGFDPLTNTPIVDVEWSDEDKLPFSFCVSTLGLPPGCEALEDVSVARGNVVLVDHGQTIHEPQPVPAAGPDVFVCVDVGQARKKPAAIPKVRLTLDKAPLAHASPFPDKARVLAQQANVLSALMDRVRGVVPALIKDLVASRPPRLLKPEEVTSLLVIFGHKHLVKVGLIDDETGTTPEAQQYAAGLAATLRKSDPKRTLTEDEIDQLVDLFGEDALIKVGLIEPDGGGICDRTPGEQIHALESLYSQIAPLRRLLAHQDHWLEAKADRVAVLLDRVRNDYVLTEDEIREIGEMFGISYVEGLNPDNPQWFGPAAIALIQDPRLANPLVSLRTQTSAADQDFPVFCSPFAGRTELRQRQAKALDSLLQKQSVLSQLDAQGVEPAIVEARKDLFSKSVIAQFGSPKEGAAENIQKRMARVGALRAYVSRGFLLTAEEVRELEALFAPEHSRDLSLDQPLANAQDLWCPRRDLLLSQATDRHFVAEIDDDGNAILRFGDNDLGQAPEPGSTFLASYRVGGGKAGNVAAGTITRMEPSDPRFTLISNPLPAAGGVDPEPMDEVRLFAPGAFRTQKVRAITSDDYAALATLHPGVQRAAATFSWTGAWYEVRVAIDAIGTEEPSPQFIAEIQAELNLYRRIGHDLKVSPARYIALDIALSVTIGPHILSGQVEADLLRVFSSTVGPDGKLGMFHPDNLTFGQNIEVSRIVAAAQAVSGVLSATVTRLNRLGDAPGGELEQGILKLGALEIPRLDNDANYPEHGQFKLTVRGGR